MLKGHQVVRMSPYRSRKNRSHTRPASATTSSRSAGVASGCSYNHRQMRISSKWSQLACVEHAGGRGNVAGLIARFRNAEDCPGLVLVQEGKGFAVLGTPRKAGRGRCVEITCSRQCPSSCIPVSKPSQPKVSGKRLVRSQLWNSGNAGRTAWPPRAISTSMRVPKNSAWSSPKPSPRRTSGNAASNASSSGNRRPRWRPVHGWDDRHPILRSKHRGLPADARVWLPPHPAGRCGPRNRARSQSKPPLRSRNFPLQIEASSQDGGMLGVVRIRSC